MSRFQPGDEVYGECHGSCAEYAVAKEGSIAPKPANLIVRAGRRRADVRLHRAAGPPRPRQGPARAEGAHQRRVRGSGAVRRADRQGARRRGDRRVQHAERGDGPLDRRGPRHRLHQGGLHQGERALRRDLGQRREPLAVGHAPRAHAQRAPRAEQRSRRHGLDHRRGAGGDLRAPAGRLRSSPSRTARACSRSTSSSRPARSRPSSTGRIRSSETAEAFAYLDEGHARGKVVIAVEPANA